MSIEIKKNKEYPLKIPRFLCDALLKDDVPPPYHLLVNGYKFITIIGRPQSGKTSLLFSLFRDRKLLKRCFNNIILVMPLESMKSMNQKDNIFKDLSEEKFFTSLDDVDSIRELVKFYASEDENSVIIIDDMTSYLKDGYVQKVLSDICFNRRHYRTSIILLSQIYNKIPLSIRKLINVCVLMYKPSRKETETIFDELLEQNEDISNQIFKLAFKKQFDKLIIDVPTQRLYINSDEVIIHDE